MNRACCLITVGMAIAVAACGTGRSGVEPEPAPMLADSRAVPSLPSASVKSAGAPLPDRPGGSAPTSAALNLRLLQQVSRAENADLPVGAGDLLEVSVFEVEELSKIRLRVPRRGVISLPLIGKIQATGRTTAELEDEIRSRLQQKFMHDPQVSVFLQEHISQRISVIGAVRKGGVFPLNRQLRLADALALAEGLADDADHVVYVTRRVPADTLITQGEGAGSVGAPPPPADSTADVMAPIDLLELADGREDLNIDLRPGDVVHVPRAGSVYVGGSVEKAGSFLLRGKTTVHQAILAAGGVKDVADWGDVRVYRRAPSGQVEVLAYDLKAFEEGQPAPEVRRNDVVVVGKSSAKAFFYGFLDFFKGALGVAKGL